MLKHKLQRLMPVVVMMVLMLTTLWVGAQETTEEAPAAATTDFNLTYSVTAAGEITGDAFAQTWTLTTASADRISIVVERTSGNLIPDVLVLDGSEQQIQTSYGATQTAARAEIERFNLPTGGTFKIVVQRDDGEAGVTSGTYSILVTPIATAAENPNNIVNLGAATLDAPVRGEITGAQWYQRYTFEAGGEDVIALDVRRTSGTLFPEVEVLDANGIALMRGYNDYNRANELAEIDRLELPGAGTYTIAVTRASGFNGETTGGYELNVRLLGAGESNPLLQGTAGTVAYDTPLSGAINAKWYEDWTLTTTAGDTLTLMVNRASGNLQPEVVVLGGSGQELRRGYTEADGDSAVIERLQLSGPGTYTVRVTRASGKTGSTSGDYALTVQLDGAGTGSASLSAIVGTIEKGQTVSGEISNAAWSNRWTFTGTAQEVIDIVVERTEGTFIPRIAILDSNNQLLTNGYYGPGLDTAEISRYTLPGNAEYRIVVFRDGEQNGYTTGGYTLTVRPTGS